MANTFAIALRGYDMGQVDHAHQHSAGRVLRPRGHRAGLTGARK